MMAQYYHPPRAASLSITSEAGFPLTEPDPFDPYSNFENTPPSSSVLVFPNPPFERESSRDDRRFEYTGSTPSLPTDVSLGSSLSPSRSRSRIRDHQAENERIWHEISLTFLRQRDERILEEEWEIPQNDLRSNRWDILKYGSPQRTRDRVRTHSHTSSIVSSLSGTTSSLTPEPPFRLPFLSCLQKFINLDESTLHLLTRPSNPHASALFPLSPGPPSPLHEDHKEEPLHGAQRLLHENPDKPRNVKFLKAALDLSDIPIDESPPLFPTRLHVWSLVGFVIKGGLRAWREVQVWHTQGEPQLVGV